MGKALRLPPGYRFHPTDDELVLLYLKRKIKGERFYSKAVAEVDIYKFAPWELPGTWEEPYIHAFLCMISVICFLCVFLTKFCLFLLQLNSNPEVVICNGTSYAQWRESILEGIESIVKPKMGAGKKPETIVLFITIKSWWGQKKHWFFTRTSTRQL